MHVRLDQLLRASGIVLAGLMIIVNFFIPLPDPVYIGICGICVILLTAGLILGRREREKEKYK